MATGIERARASKDAKYLDTLIRTHDGRILTRRQRLERLVEAGAWFELQHFDDDAKRRKLERRLDSMRRANNGWGIPWGNASHPRTIEAQAIKDELAGRITEKCCVVRLAGHPDDSIILSRTEHAYVVELLTALGNRLPLCLMRMR